MKHTKPLFLFLFILLSTFSYSQKLKVIKVKNLDLNSKYAEIGIKHLDSNKVLFASSKKNNLDDKRDKRNNRHGGLRLYTAYIHPDGRVSDVKLFSKTAKNPINESNITFTSDYKTVYFTRNNYIDDDYRKEFEKGSFDIHILKIFKADISPEGRFSNITLLPINSRSYSVTNPYLSPDNKKLYFVSNMKGSFGGFDIYEMDIHADGTYGDPENLGINVNSNGNEMFPFVTDDNILYFSSNGHGGLGGLDIFGFDLEDKYARSINLRSPINSNKDDFSFIYNSNNFTGHFASTRKGGLGGADLYHFTVQPPPKPIEAVTSRKVKIPKTNIVIDKGPCNILIKGVIKDYKTNSPISNAKLYLIRNNEQVAATATKSDGSYSFEANCNELYEIDTDKLGYEKNLFYIKKSFKDNSIIVFNGSLKPSKCVQVLNGLITDLNTGEPLINIKVDLLDKKGDLVDIAQSDTNGDYHFTLNCKDKYIVNISSKLHEPVSSEFETTSENKQVSRLDFSLKPLPCTQTLEGIVLNSRTKVPMGNVEVSLIKDGQIIKTKMNQSSGIFNFKIDCETNYTVNASSKYFYENSKEVTTTNARNTTFDFSIKLESKLDFDMIRDEMMILTGPISFDLNRSDIRDDAAIELGKIVNAMKKNPNISVAIGVHTDSQAPDSYNMTLSEERAQSIKSYIISKGINRNRLTNKGYGETQLLNRCANGVRCTKKEHLKNQRVEFIVSQ